MGGDRPHNQLYYYDGEEHTLSEWAKIKGMRYGSVIQRLNRGMSIDEVLSFGPERVRKLYTYNGKTMGIREWAEEVGMDPKTIHKRMDRGIPFEDAINPTPIRKVYAIRGIEKTSTEWAEIAGVTTKKAIDRIRLGSMEKLIPQSFWDEMEK